MISAKCDLCGRAVKSEDLTELSGWAKKSGAIHMCRKCEKDVARYHAGRRMALEQQAKADTVEYLTEKRLKVLVIARTEHLSAG